MTLEQVRHDDRARLQRLLAGRWSAPGDHPISRLAARPLGDYRLLVLLGPKNNVGSRYFQLFLVDREGRLADRPLALGLYSSGPFPAYNWVELIQYHPLLSVDAQALDLPALGLDLPLFLMLSELVPPGGHLMVEYDSPGQQTTERVLTRGYPPATSPTGYLMFQAGCRSFRDWYISEGGREGPRKLQGFKPLNEEIAREKTQRLREQLAEFLSRPEQASASGGWEAGARRLAREVLGALEKA
ncbi:MAG: DUF1122 family protein [Dehalococcoidia bacterium]|nr:DUF1122 family protein [Dehalococcoidia bacterium]